MSFNHYQEIYILVLFLYYNILYLVLYYIIYLEYILENTSTTRTRETDFFSF